MNSKKLGTLVGFALLLGACHRKPDPASGGARLEYVLETDATALPDATAQAQGVVKKRLEALKIDAEVSVIGKRIQVDLPGGTAATADLVKNELATGKLEIREVDDGAAPADGRLPPGTLEVTATMPDGRIQPVRLRPGGIGPGSVEDAEVRTTDMNVAVDVRFNKAAATAFEKLSRDNIDKPLAIVLDGKVLSMPIVKTPITDGRVQITMGTGDLAKQRAEAEALVRALEAGAIHGKLVLESESIVPPLR